MTSIIETFSEISDKYDALFVDLWGCMHNGVSAYPEAVAAMRKYRASGGLVVMVTNSPQPRAGVVAQLSRIGVPDDTYDLIATSGDSARAAMFQGVAGKKVWFMGIWERDAAFFDPMRIVRNPVIIERVSLEYAEGIVCCGPFDPLLAPEAHGEDFADAIKRGLKLLCANPDVVVDRGNIRHYCAGSLAQLYTRLGGESLYFGKPHPPIYDLARKRLDSLGMDEKKRAILAIGDGIGTDIRGANAEKIDSLFVSGGLAAAQTKTTANPCRDALHRFLERENTYPTYTIGRLR